MIRLFILIGFILMFALMHRSGDLNKYINMKYAYLSIGAIVLLSVLAVVEFVRIYRQESAELKRKVEKEAGALAGAVQLADNADADARRGGGHIQSCCHDTVHDHHGHRDKHDRHHHHHHGHDDGGFGHSHEPVSRWKRAIGYLILIVPIATGIFLPVQTLDSSFVKAKGFSFPTFEDAEKNPGQHQFLKPDTSIFYGKAGYEKQKEKELAEFAGMGNIKLTDDNYLKGMEALYNNPGEFIGSTISFDGFAYKGEQVDGDHFFVFRFGFIHCVADSGVFGMLVDFPKNTELQDNDWVNVTGKLTWEFYQPFKQTIPVLQVTSWTRIEAPKDPYVYRL
ncbi:TIGR03943 family protein [Paenibacillus sp. NEAU-GSW1]|uniref:TIGR03943 family putative permease subunit n=1 Tax=Paenibacillus sp. NEAU-GSW1 TaxID=2682486 RepID=UPI0012E3017E|nr:TIGR03943 family protein [Paenibacillus sp. NEAU-GSW1]MUT65213.1 TIGR03943 family protein [Paenibacillus sp. NEAU-GSW1]